MSQSKIHCSCGGHLANAKDGEIMLWCKRCKRQIPLGAVLRRISQSERTKNKCNYCADAVIYHGFMCPHKKCPYKDMMEEYKKFLESPSQYEDFS